MADPQTPPLSAASHRGFYDSPFSDYHTDSSRSSNSTTSSAQKELMRRLNLIGAMIQQSEPGTHLARAMHSKLDAVEAFLAAPEPQSRLHLEDSGLFMEDDEIRTREEPAEEFLEEIPEEELADDCQTTFDLDRIAQSVEEHMDYMNQLLDEAKGRERELEGYLGEMRESKDKLCERFDEVKRNNTAALEHIGLQNREIKSLKAINKVMEEHIEQVEESNDRLHAQLESLQPLSSSRQDPTHTRWKPSLQIIDDHNDEQSIPKASTPTPTASRWTTFWKTLNDMAGVVDYDEVMQEID